MWYSCWKFKKSLEIRLLLYSVGKTARTSLPCSNALTPWHCLGLKSKLKILWKKWPALQMSTLFPVFSPTCSCRARDGMQGWVGEEPGDEVVQTCSSPSTIKVHVKEHYIIVWLKISQLVFHIPYWDANTRISGFHLTSSPPCWWTVNKRSLISSLCLSTSICSFHHCHLCPPRLLENHLFMTCKCKLSFSSFLPHLRTPKRANAHRLVPGLVVL